MLTTKILITTFTLATLLGCSDPIENPAPEIYFDMTDNNYEVNINNTLTITPQITYDYNSSYQWIKDGEVKETTKSLQLIPKELTIEKYQFIVSTPTGSDTASISVYAMHIFNFEELELKKDTFQCGNNEATSFNSTNENLIVTFPQQYIEKDATWYGFAYSNKTTNSTKKPDNALSAYPCYGANKSSNYVVFHQTQGDQSLRIKFPENIHHRIRSIDIVNPTYVYNAIKSGTNIKTKFGDSDWYKLTICGYRADGTKTNELVINLADYTPIIRTERYLIDAWTTKYLEELGRVNEIEFKLTSSQSETDVLNTLSYLCIDNIKVMD